MSPGRGVTWRGRGAARTIGGRKPPPLAASDFNGRAGESLNLGPEMIRSRRRPPAPDPVPTDAGAALEYERTGWPDPSERRRWWSQPGVPAHLRRAPDPRRILGADDAVRLDYEAERAAWAAARLTWLMEVANG